MTTKRIRRFVAAGIAAAALSGGMAAPALAQTREHIFLARQLSIDVDDTPTAQGSSAVVSLGKLGRVE